MVMARTGILGLGGRQWVLSVPRRVRFLLATEHVLLSEVLDMALRKVFARYEGGKSAGQTHRQHKPGFSE